LVGLISDFESVHCRPLVILVYVLNRPAPPE